MIKLHYHIYASYKLRTYLVGYPYDSMEDEHDDTQFQKKIMKLSLQELKQRNVVRQKKAKEVAEEKNIKTETYIDEDFEVTVLKD